MKIECVATSRVPSSTANSIQVMKVCEALAALDHQIKLCIPAFGETATWDTLAELYGLKTPFEIKWLPFRKELKQYDFCLQAASLAKEWKADAMYTWALQAAVFAQRRALPVLMEFHDLPTGQFGPFLFRRYIAGRSPTLTLCTTHALIQKLENQYGFMFDASVVRVAPNGTDPEVYARLPQPSAARAQLGLPDQFSVVYSGHFYPGRGMDLLVGLAQALSGIQFVWVGGKPEDVQPWKERLSELKITNVIITGFIHKSKLPLYQAAADILVMPYGSQIEGSSGGNIAAVINPMKMFDYLASGRPIVATDLPVLHEILNKTNAVFCPAGDMPAWIAAISALQQDSATRTSLGKKAKADSMQYSWLKREEDAIAQLENLMRTHKKA